MGYLSSSHERYPQSRKAQDPSRCAGSLLADLPWPRPVLHPVRLFGAGLSRHSADAVPCPRPSKPRTFGGGVGLLAAELH
eukprot:7335876-Alexandrium_andersonii.AAC.1